MNIYIITNFRILPFLSIFYEVLKNKKITKVVLLSRESLKSFDYGEYMPLWNKKLKIFFLSLFTKVLIIDTKCNLDEEIDTTGIISSLVSITSDSNADKFKYPELYTNFYNLAKGAYSVQLFLDGLKIPYELFLFNGRGASQFSIALYASRNHIKTSFFEYGNSSYMGYKLFPYTPHSSMKIGQDLNIHFKKKNKSNFLTPNQKKLALELIDEKLNNIFTQNLSITDLNYDVLVFLGSDHEYTGVSEEISNFRILGNLKLCEYAYNKYGSKYTIAVRAHPNQKVDPSANFTNQKIKDFCETRGIVFFNYDSTISSHSLIKNCKIVVTEYSSISYDAIYLEKEVDIMGDLDLKVILSELPIEIKTLGPIEVKLYVAYIKHLESNLHFVSFNLVFKYICFFLTIIERKFFFKSDFIK